MLHVGRGEHIGPSPAGDLILQDARQAVFRLHRVAAFCLECLGDIGQGCSQAAGGIELDDVGACRIAHGEDAQDRKGSRRAALHHAPGPLAFGKNN